VACFEVLVADLAAWVVTLIGENRPTDLDEVRDTCQEKVRVPCFAKDTS
jgi:hypothetical protein